MINVIAVIRPGLGQFADSFGQFTQPKLSAQNPQYTWDQRGSDSLDSFTRPLARGKKTRGAYTRMHHAFFYAQGSPSKTVETVRGGVTRHIPGVSRGQFCSHKLSKTV